MYDFSVKIKKRQDFFCRSKLEFIFNKLPTNRIIGILINYHINQEVLPQIPGFLPMRRKYFYPKI